MAKKVTAVVELMLPAQQATPAPPVGPALGQQASYLLKKAAKVQSGSGDPKRQKVGKITVEQLREIAKMKLKDMNTTDLNAAMRTIAGTAKSMGIEIEGWKE
jgi:large subunit ribosomal protein L11